MRFLRLEYRYETDLNHGLPGLGLTRRTLLRGAASTTACVALGAHSFAVQSPAFAQWVAGFRARALARGISEQTFDRVMGAVTPDTSVFAQYQAQPEFTELLWQYINRRCSGWRVATGKIRAKENAELFARVEKDYGVDRYILLGLWGMESSFGDVVANPKYIKQVRLALAALVWGAAPAPIKQELLNALSSSTAAGRPRKWRLLGRRRVTPSDARGLASPGIDYDKDGRVSPFGKPDDRSPAARATSPARPVSPGETGATRCARVASAGQGDATYAVAGAGVAARTARFRSPGQGSGSRCAAAPPSWSDRISMRSIHTTRRRVTR